MASRARLGMNSTHGARHVRHGKPGRQGGWAILYDSHTNSTADAICTYGEALSAQVGRRHFQRDLSRCLEVG